MKNSLLININFYIRGGGVNYTKYKLVTELG